MGKAKWIPGLPTSPGWYMIKGDPKHFQDTVIRVEKQEWEMALKYWIVGGQFRQWVDDLHPYYTHHCRFTFPED